VQTIWKKNLQVMSYDSAITGAWHKERFGLWVLKQLTIQDRKSSNQTMTMQEIGVHNYKSKGKVHQKQM
jgi:hypothetical protein